RRRRIAPGGQDDFSDVHNWRTDARLQNRGPGGKRPESQGARRAVFCRELMYWDSLFTESKFSRTRSSGPTSNPYSFCTNDTSSINPIESMMPCSRNEASSSWPNVSVNNMFWAMY